MPAPAKAPTAAEYHRVAAVLRPRTLSPSRMITPAPRNPIPDTIWAATRVGSAVAPLNPFADNNTNKVAPTATRALVRNPAIRARYWRSNPMTVPRPIPAPRRSSISTVFIGSAPSGGLDDLDHDQGGGHDQVAAQGEQPRFAKGGERGPIQGGQRGGAPRRPVLIGEGFAFVAGEGAGGRTQFADLVWVEVTERCGDLFDRSAFGAAPGQRDQTPPDQADPG